MSPRDVPSPLSDERARTLSAAQVTLVPETIHNPAEPRHFMVIEPQRGRFRAEIDGVVLAESDRVLVLREVGGRICDPVLYFPIEDATTELLRATGRWGRCPLKGRSQAYDLQLPDRRIQSGAWRYEELLDFDPKLERLEGRVAFAADLIDLRRVGYGPDRRGA